MDDSVIISLFLQRDEKAIKEMQKKYEKYCYSIAYHVLNNHEDAEECVNDTYMAAWNSIPPHNPNSLASFLAKITRNLSLKKHRDQHTQKRGGNTVVLTLDELSECIPAPQTIESDIRQEKLAKLLDTFLRTLPEEDCNIFLRRYWYFDSIAEISARFGYGESKIKMTLFRTRKKLYEKLKQEELL